MEKVISQCKNCGSELSFDPIKQILTCTYCETSYHLPKAKMNAVLVRGYSNSFHPNQLNQGLNCFRCEMCGHTYFSSSEEKSKGCDECGNIKVIKVQSAGYCADGIIPFELSKKEAETKLKNYLSLVRGIPKEMIQNANAQNLKGVFVPVWNFIFDMDATYSANASELKKDNNGMYYTVPIPVFGTRSESVRSADQNATSVEMDELLDLFDERDYDKIIPYSPEYTFGFQVDDINRSIHDYYDIVIDSEERKLRKQISDDILNNNKDVNNLNIKIVPREVYFNFAYVPVYVYTYFYRGKTYKIYISGTTGKVAGKTPISIKHIFKKIAKYFGLFAAIAILALLILK